MPSVVNIDLGSGLLIYYRQLLNGINTQVYRIFYKSLVLGLGCFSMGGLINKNVYWFILMTY